MAAKRRDRVADPDAPDRATVAHLGQLWAWTREAQRTPAHLWDDEGVQYWALELARVLVERAALDVDDLQENGGGQVVKLPGTG